MGGCAYIAEYAMSGADARRTAIPGTLTLALRIGRAIREAREAHRDPFEALLALLPQTPYSFGAILFRGKIVDLQRETRNGFALGRTAIASLDGASRMELQFQNENLIAREDGEVRAIVPDLICVLDSATAGADHHGDAALRPARDGDGGRRAADHAHAGGSRRVRTDRVRHDRTVPADRDIGGACVMRITSGLLADLARGRRLPRHRRRRRPVSRPPAGAAGA